MHFKKLHHQSSPLLLCNVWDVASAKVAEQLNFQAIGTSSGAIASMLGYEDGEHLPFAEMVYIIQRISKSVQIPLTVDLEAGYSRNPDEVVAHIERLAALGVVGINIEDSLVEQERFLLDSEQFSKTLQLLCKQLKERNVEMFVNVRTDTFLLACENRIEETTLRAGRYKEAGADGIFVPGLVHPTDIKSIVDGIDLPLNVMCMPRLPDFEFLKTLGVQRISMGNFLFNRLSYHLMEELQSIRSSHSFQNLFA